MAAELERRFLRVADMVLFRMLRVLLRLVDSLAVVVLLRLDERSLLGALYGLGRLFAFHWRSRSCAESRISSPRMPCTCSTTSWR
jgi:hypothetical protein